MAQAEAHAKGVGGDGWTLFTLCLASFLSVSVTLILRPFLAELAADLGVSASVASWSLIIVGLVGSGAGCVAAGSGALVGNKRVLVFSLGLLACGSLLCGVAPGIVVLVVGRAVQGLAAGIVPVSLGITAVHFRGARLKHALGVLMAAQGAAGLGSSLGAGLLFELGGSWRMVFWVMLAGALLVIPLAWRFVRETPTGHARIDVVGAILLMVSLFCTLLPLSQGAVWGWTSCPTLGLLASGLGLLLVWLAVELRSTHPLVDLRMLTLPAVWRIALVFFVAGWTGLGLGMLYPYLIQTAHSLGGYGFGRSVLVVSLLLACLSVGTASVPPLAGRLSLRYGDKPLLVAGAFLSAGTHLALAVSHSQLWHLAVFALVWGTSYGLAAGPGYHAAMQAVTTAEGGVVSGLIGVIAGVGSAAGGAVIALVLTLRDVPGHPGVPAGSTFTLSFAVTAVVCLGGLLAMLTLNQRAARNRKVGTSSGDTPVQEIA